MKTQLEFYIGEIAQRIERLHELCEHALEESIVAFANLDIQHAKEVKAKSCDIDELADKVEDNVFETIARRQPVARDLRTLATYLHLSHHLYRIGRFAYKVAHIVTLSDGLEHFKKLESLPHLADLAKQCLKIAMDATLKGDLTKIDELEKLEAESDKETEEMFLEISEYLRKQEGIEKMAMFYVIVGRYYERAADHAFQIAEKAIYIATGEKRKLGKAYKSREWVGPH